ncbi:hypothetical protein ACFWMQ_25210 [Streptomyces sp. NPDC058372]|uniref:hypothetical protein n=1 Tax=Streptomyces sp. NPDC058372 TaxID=3346464 RepID=UPI003661CA6D
MRTTPVAQRGQDGVGLAGVGLPLGRGSGEESAHHPGPGLGLDGGPDASEIVAGLRGLNGVIA